ncbi:PQQ-binding-like beta-propeller repeat protein [Oleiharenicola lentus]|jgi:outer membrane protein assembly factor BamB|nr:PQQ-binding-like beta-propeller repeat protein [Oleiharenicola lentus]
MIAPILRSFRTVAAVALLTAAISGWAAASKPVWTLPLGEDAKWETLTDLGVLLVGTDSAIHCIDPDTGKVLWKNATFKKSNTMNAREIPGTPFLLCNQFSGMANSKSTFTLIDYLTGETEWTAPEVSGQYLGTIPVPEKGLAILVMTTWKDGKGQEHGTFLFAHDLATGERKWSTLLTKANGIPLHMADNSGKFMPRMDLSGYHDPVLEGDTLYLGYLGVHALDLNTGAIKWGVEFPPGDKGLKRTYAPLRIVGDVLYGAGGGSIHAINKETGATLWKSDRISEYAGLFKARDNAIVTQIEVIDDKIYARYGGNFSNGQTVMLKEPLGVVVVSAADGKPLYQDKKIEGGLTNLMALPEIGAVMFADGKELVGLSAGATVEEIFRVPIEFKRKMGGGDIAKIGLGLTGGLMGTVKAVSSSSKARLDVPVAITRQDGHIVVQGKQHLLGFDPVAKGQKWSLYYAAPSDAFATIAMFAVTLAASAQGNAQVAQNGSIMTSGGRQGMENIQNALDRYNRYTETRARKIGGSKSSGGYTYIITKLEKEHGGGVGLVGVNLGNGETDRRLALGDKEPKYLADEAAGRIFYFKGGDQIQAYEF